MERNYDSDYQVRLATLEALGGDTTKQYDSVYEIDLEILRLTEQGSGADIQTVDVLPDAETNKDKIVRLSTDNQIYFVVDNSGTWEWEALVVTETQVINDNVTSTETTWSSSKIDEELQSVAGTANSEFDGKTTEDFTFVTELPVSGEEGQQVIIKGENVDTLYKYVSDAWVEQTPDANILYFDTVNEALYSYITAEHQFAPISIVNTIVVGKNLNSNVALKNVKEPGVYNVLQRTSSTTKGEYTKKWTLTVEGVDYDEYELTDSVYQKLQSNYTIQKRTWSSSRQTNDGWTTFATYYAGEIKDTKTSKYYTWSSNKLSGELATKQDVLTPSTNITIDASNNISADGYVFDSTNGAISTIYRQDAADGGALVANTATGLGAFAEGYLTTATGNYGSHAEGSETTASGNASHAEGFHTTASESYAHSEGYKTTASGKCSHTEGDWTSATERDAHAEGWYTTASARASHAEGLYTDATGEYSHAEGWGLSTLHNLASGQGSHVEGIGTKATNMGAHAEGYGSQQAPNIASAYGAHAEGCLTIAQNQGEHAEGNCNVSHKASDIEGNAGNTVSSIGIAFGDNSGNTRKNAREVMQNGDYYLFGIGNYDGIHIKGEVSGTTVQTLQEVITGKQDTLTAGSNISISSNTISADGYVWDASTGGFAEKYKQDAGDGGQVLANTANALGAHAEGYNTTASGAYGSHAEGNVSVASGYVAHAEGNRTTSSGVASHAEGTHTTASADCAHAEGAQTTASGNNSHAEGLHTVASGYFSHAEGQGSANVKNTASGKASHVEGTYNTAQNFSEHAEGAANVSHRTEIDDENNFGNAGNTIHSIGIGRYTNSRKNAIEVMQNGDMYVYGVGGYVGTDTKVQDNTIKTLQEYIATLEARIAVLENPNA
jgi:hypothetical protein